MERINLKEFLLSIRELGNKNMEKEINPKNINFHPVLKDIENMFWFFLLSIRSLSDFDIQNILKQKNATNDGYASFNDMLEKFNQTTGLKIEITGNKSTSKLNILNQMVFMGKAMAILTYDYLSLSSYNNDINKEEQFIFLRFIRNGAAHYNKFNLKDEDGIWKLDDSQEVRWEDKKITRHLHGSVVFNDFIALPEIFLLVNYFSDRLNEIDKCNKQSKIIS